MNSDEILILGLKRSVSAISRRDGRVLWQSRLPGGVGDGFVTVISDGALIYAHTQGKLHCLDLADGRLLWSNELIGYGYGIASLCLPAGPAAPDIAAVEKRSDEQRRSRNSSAHS